MKRLSNLKLSSLIFGILMCLPMFSILARVIYVQSNPNAKDSYYGETINQESQTNYQPQNLELNKEYYLSNVLLPNNDYPSMVSSSNLFSVILLETNNPNLEPFLNISSYMRFYRGSGSVGSNTQYYIYFANNINFDNSVNYGISTTYTIKLLINSYTWNITSTYVFEPFFDIQYNDYSYIDNVFDYSLSKFLEEDNYSLNFFNFFDNVFLNQSGKNMLYINFLNWYMNYALLVSSAYCLFFVLYFFINMVRQLVMSFTNKIDGGF